MRDPVVRQVVCPGPQQGLPVQLLQLSNFCCRQKSIDVSMCKYLWCLQSNLRSRLSYFKILIVLKSPLTGEQIYFFWYR